MSKSICCNDLIDDNYGFARGAGFKGMGVYGICCKCFRICSWTNDAEMNTDEENQHNLRHIKMILKLNNSRKHTEVNHE